MHVENMKGWTGRGSEGTEQRVMDTQHKKTFSVGTFDNDINWLYCISCCQQSVAQQIEIPDEFVHYFGLFLVKKEDDGDSSSE